MSSSPAVLIGDLRFVARRAGDGGGILNEEGVGLRGDERTFQHVEIPGGPKPGKDRRRAIADEGIVGVVRRVVAGPVGIGVPVAIRIEELPPRHVEERVLVAGCHRKQVDMTGKLSHAG